MWYLEGALITGILFLILWIGLGTWYGIEYAISFINDKDDFSTSDAWDTIADVVFFDTESYGDSAGKIHPINIMVGLISIVLWPVAIISGVVTGIVLYLRKCKRVEKEAKSDLN